MREPSQANPWTPLSTREVYANPWIRVREDQVRRPDGNPGIYGVVEFRNLALGVVPITADGETYLVGQYRYTLDRYSWEIPEGGGAKDRHPLDEIRRELEEETGLTAGRWTYLGPIHTSNSVTDEVGHLYLAEELTEGPPQPEGTEQLVVRKLPLAEAVRMAQVGEISDALAAVGLLRADAYLRSGRTLVFPPAP